MDEEVQRALRVIERAGIRLITRPSDEAIRCLRFSARFIDGEDVAHLRAWMVENGISTGCVICDAGPSAAPHSCVGYDGPTGPQASGAGGAVTISGGSGGVARRQQRRQEPRPNRPSMAPPQRQRTHRVRRGR